MRTPGGGFSTDLKRPRSRPWPCSRAAIRRHSPRSRTTICLMASCSTGIATPIRSPEFEADRPPPPSRRFPRRECDHSDVCRRTGEIVLALYRRLSAAGSKVGACGAILFPTRWAYRGRRHSVGGNFRRRGYRPGSGAGGEPQEAQGTARWPGGLRSVCSATARRSFIAEVSRPALSRSRVPSP